MRRFWSWSRALAALVALAVVAMAMAARAGAGDATAPGDGRIGFDVTALDDRGLTGPPDGLRAVHYEFCIPADAAAQAEVTGIDPTAVVYPHSPGRVGCRGDRVLVIGSSHQPQFRVVLARLAALPYVLRIERADFE